MRTLTAAEQNMICGATFDGNNNLERTRFYLYDIGGAALGALAGAQSASLMGHNLLGQGIGIMIGAATGTIFGQMLNKIVSTTGKSINE
tara:strand:- start:20890 stop:21156 length:267 start_codon:yes stop_codon:yes gene_type:complete